MARLNAMQLIMVSLIVLILPGVIFNNLVASGYNQAGEPTLTCGGPYLPGQPVDPTCQGSVNVGCQAVPTGCELSGASISFLNQHSPFTQLIQGNIGGFFNNLVTSTNYIPGAFDTLALPTNVAFPVSCYARDNTTQSAVDVFSCTATSPSGANLTKLATPTITATPFLSNGSLVHFYNLQVTNRSSYNTGQDQYYLGGLSLVVLYTVIQGGGYGLIGYNYYFCQYYQTYSGSTNYWNFIVATNSTQTIPADTNFHFYGYAEPVAFRTFPGLTSYLHPQGLGPSSVHPLGVSPTTQALTNLVTQAKTSVTTGGVGNSGTTGVVLAFLAGIFLFLLGLGINFQISGDFLATGGGVGAGVNQQGTRLAQTLGLFLIGWTPLYSEFSSWFTSGVFPYGLDGATGIISIIVVAMGFFGVFWLTLSWGE